MSPSQPKVVSLTALLLKDDYATPEAALQADYSAARLARIGPGGRQTDT